MTTQIDVYFTPLTIYTSNVPVIRFDTVRVFGLAVLGSTVQKAHTVSEAGTTVLSFLTARKRQEHVR